MSSALHVEKYFQKERGLPTNLRFTSGLFYEAIQFDLQVNSELQIPGRCNFFMWQSSCDNCCAGGHVEWDDLYVVCNQIW